MKLDSIWLVASPSDSDTDTCRHTFEYRIIILGYTQYNVYHLKLLYGLIFFYTILISFGILVIIFTKFSFLLKKLIF